MKSKKTYIYILIVIGILIGYGTAKKYIQSPNIYNEDMDVVKGDSKENALQLDLVQAIDSDEKFTVIGEEGGSEARTIISEIDTVETVKNGLFGMPPEASYLYPIIKLNRNEKEKEDWINETLFKTLVYREIEPWTMETYKKDIGRKIRRHVYDMEFKSDNIVSFASNLYWFDILTYAKPTNIVGGITIDVEKGEELYLEDIIDYSDDFFKTLHEEELYEFWHIGSYWLENRITLHQYFRNHTEITGHKRALTKEELKVIFHYKYSEKPNTINSFFIYDKGVVIVMPDDIIPKVSKESGDHAKYKVNSIFISYEDLKPYLKRDVWKSEIVSS